MPEEYGEWRTVLPSTGIPLLDDCLSSYAWRCCDCGVDFGVSVIVWPLWLVKMGVLSEDGLLGLFDNILRMGLRSVSQYRGTDRSLLLCMGIAGENYEIDCYSSGNLLSDRISQSISQGIPLPTSAQVRTDGILRALEESGASLYHSKEEGAFRSRLTFVFDGRGSISLRGQTDCTV